MNQERRFQVNNEKKAPVLTLEHLSPYLPYGLMAEMLDCKSDYVGKQYDQIVGFHQWDKNCLYWSVLTIGGSKPNIERIKPILRPLSDLTKEIEHNGERFVPWVEINKFLNGGKFQAHYNIIEYNEWDSLTIGFGDHCAGYSLNLESLPVIQMLFKWHFDLFELISQNLAIDINSIEGKETKGNG